MSDRAPGDRARRRLRARLGLALAGVALLVAGVAGYSTVRLVGAAVDRRLDQALELRLQGVESARGALESRVSAGLARLVGHLERNDPGLLTRLLEGGPEVADVARLLLPITGLDQLDLTDGAGVLLSSTYRAEQAGLLLQPRSKGESGFEGFPEGPGARIAFRLGRSIEVRGRTLVLIGGTLLGENFLSEIAAGESAAFVDEHGTSSSSVGRGDFERSELGDRLRWDGPADGAIRTDGAIYGARSLRQRDGSELAWVAVSVDRSERQRLLDSLVRLFVMLGAVAGVAAGLAGLLIARGTSRPVAELVRAVDAIGAGEADYTFTRQAEDEFQELISAFSRLHRSLELQQQRSRAAERVAAWREVARHVAHEVKNPLVPIRLTVENLQRVREKDPDRFEEMLEQGMRTILEEVDRLRRIVGEFSEFARMPIPERRPVDPAGLIDEVLRLYAAEPGLEIERIVEPGLPAIEVDGDQISRALKNVVGNAIEAMRGPTNDDRARKRLELRAVREADWVTIEIADSGDGFSVDAAERIFEPYYTTKSGGTGIGMWITQRIITEHGGVISAENRPTGGARVVLRLPVRAGTGTPR